MVEGWQTCLLYQCIYPLDEEMQIWKFFSKVT